MSVSAYRIGALLDRPGYNLGNFLRRLATLEPIRDWSLTSLEG